MTIQNITMPQLGESVTEGTIERWLVKPGDVVKKYDPLAEVTTDKVSAEIPSSFEGKVHELIVKEGSTLPVGAVVCSIEIEGDMAKQTKPTSSISPTLNNVSPPKKTGQIGQSDYMNTPKPTKVAGRFSPAVLALANEHQIDLNTVECSGLGGRITRKDVEKHIATGSNSEQNTDVQQESGSKKEQQNSTEKDTKLTNAHDQKATPPTPTPTPTPTPVTTAAGDIEIPVTGVRRAIATNMVRAKTEVPHAWMMVEVDVTDLVKYRNSIKDEFKQKEGYNLTYFAFFVKAVAQALREFPIMNSMWAGDKIIQKKEINLSIAVATGDALYVPVLKNVDEKSIKGIAREIHELAQLVRSGKLKSEHMQGGTFTVNNTGSFGSIQSAGIINYPQAAILQVEAIVKKPVIIQGNMFAARDIVNLCLSLDHRVLDGLVCGKFLSRVKELLENVDKETISVY